MCRVHGYSTRHLAYQHKRHSHCTDTAGIAETLRACDQISRAAHRLRRFSIGTPDYLFGPPLKSHHRHRNVIRFIWIPYSCKCSLLRLLRAIYVSMPEATPLGLTAMALPGKTGGRPRTATAIVADTQVGYDPDSMMWATVTSSHSGPELPQPFKSAALAAAVARREQASNAVTAASANAASPDAAADAEARTCSPTLAPPAPRSAGPQQGKKRPLWQPQPLPKPKATDFVVVLKPRTQLSLATVFPENGVDRALIAHLGATATRLVTVVMVREQNLILTYTSNPQIADKLIGEFAVPSPVGPVPLFGYLRVDTQDSCYGIVAVRSSDTEATLRESLYWPEGEILHVRLLGTSNKVRLTFYGKVKSRYVSYDALLIPVQPYKKTVPACGRCGSVGHRPDACPGPKSDLCGICGKAVPLTDGARAPHECTPRCALCAGPHVTADRCCKERYWTPPPKSPTPEGQAGPIKRKRRRRQAHFSRYPDITKHTTKIKFSKCLDKTVPK
ncbi:hypothetical protein HPB49_024610 [Dermacentor silvarum]|uniref:Uncharacterized protein n=1 Tax=Dermacentor silvarum TaxID=543639 RepID=A0ACB8D0X5_DERSI|nr:hypothetical protein HPB49_024610 [Dermacentor silvarum]